MDQIFTGSAPATEQEALPVSSSLNGDEPDQRRRDLESGIARIHPETGEAYVVTSWASVDLGPYKRGEQVIAPPRWMRRLDGQALIYPGRPHVFYGESETLKSWAALLACAGVVHDGGRAVYVDLEGSEPSFVERCRLVGVPEADIGNKLRYVRPIDGLFGDARVDFWHHELDVFAPTLVVLDGVTELYSLQGWDINKATDAAQFQKTFAFHGHCASIAIDHTAKDAGRGSLGSQHKRAGLDGAEYLFEPLVAAGRGRRGMSRVRVKKDRHGFVREWANDVVGSLVLDATGAADVATGAVYLEPPRLSDVTDPRDDAMDRVMGYVHEHPGTSGNQVIRDLHMNRDRVQDALQALEVQGRIKNVSTSQARKSWIESSAQAVSVNGLLTVRPPETAPAPVAPVSEAAGDRSRPVETAPQGIPVADFLAQRDRLLNSEVQAGIIDRARKDGRLVDDQIARERQQAREQQQAKKPAARKKATTKKSPAKPRKRGGTP